MSEHHLPMTMALILGVGGVMGYVKGRSMPSLIAGTALGSGFALAAITIKSGRMVEGHSLALASGLATVGGTARRALKSGATIPKVLCGLGLGASAYHARKVLDWWD